MAMVPHQHLRAPGNRKNVPEGRLYVNWIPTGETLKKVFVEERIKNGQKTRNAPVRINTTAHDDETPAGQTSFTENSIEALQRRCLQT